MTPHNWSRFDNIGRRNEAPEGALTESESKVDTGSTGADLEPLPKIAFFTPAPNYGGAQRVTVNIANSLAERGHDVDLVAGNLRGEFVNDIDDAVRTVDLDVPRVPALGILAGVPHLKSYIESARPQVLFSSRTHTNITAILAARAATAELHVAATEHSDYTQVENLKERVTGALAAQTYRFADDIVAVSKGVAESVVRNTPVSVDETTVLHNPVDIEDVQTTAEKGVNHEWFADPTIETIVSVGRLERQKDLSTLLRAFDRLQESRSEVRLIIVGKGSEREQLESLATSLGIQNAVSFEGYVENPYAYMRGSSVFVLSSQYEGLPTVLIEALACGSSIVATDCPHGPREVLSDGEYGRLTPVGEPDALAATINEALEEPVPGVKSRQRAEDFSMEAGADRYEAYVRRVTATDS